MKWTNVFNPGWVYIEVRPGSLRLAQEEQSIAIPLQRQSNGKLTSDCKEKVALGLRGFLRKKGWQPRIRAWCAIDARGVSLRRLSLPVAPNEDVQKVLRLQIEREFPLGPEALAWGFTTVEQPSAVSNGRHEMLVAALKKELLEDYAQMFADCGVNPLFTLAALERSRICPHPANSFALLDIGRRQSELISFKDGAPEWIRILPWGGGAITRAIEQSLGVTQDEAEKLKLQWDEGPVPNGEIGQRTQAAISKALESLAQGLNAAWTGERLYLTGRGARYKELPRRLKDLLPRVLDCERIETPRGDGPTAAILGLKKSNSNGGISPPLLLRLKDTRSADAAIRPGQSPAELLAWLSAQAREILAQPQLKRWVRLGIALCACALCFPLLETFAVKPILSKRIADYNAQTNRLDAIDREFGFLQHLKKTQPPYLDALTVVANSAAPGTRFEAVSMNAKGDLSLKGSLRDAQQVVDFRSKLIKSGFFSSVTVEEETPSPDRQKIGVRIAAQWKSAGLRPPVKAEPLPKGAGAEGGFMPLPGMMEGGPPPGFPGGDMPPAMPIMRGGPPPGAPTIPKATKSKSSARTVRVGPNGEIIVTGGDTSKSSTSDGDSKDSKDSSEPKN